MNKIICTSEIGTSAHPQTFFDILEEVIEEREDNRWDLSPKSAVGSQKSQDGD
jgi:hypothetical protein